MTAPTPIPGSVRRRTPVVNWITAARLVAAAAKEVNATPSRWCKPSTRWVIAGSLTGACRPGTSSDPSATRARRTHHRVLTRSTSRTHSRVNTGHRTTTSFTGTPLGCGILETVLTAWNGRNPPVTCGWFAVCPFTSNGSRTEPLPGIL